MEGPHSHWNNHVDETSAILQGTAPGAAEGDQVESDDVEGDVVECRWECQEAENEGEMAMTRRDKCVEVERASVTERERLMTANDEVDHHTSRVHDDVPQEFQAPHKPPNKPVQ